MALRMNNDKINEKTLIYCFLIKVGFHTTGEKNTMSIFQVLVSREIDI